MAASLNANITLRSTDELDSNNQMESSSQFYSLPENAEENSTESEEDKRKKAIYLLRKRFNFSYFDDFISTIHYKKVNIENSNFKI